MTFAARVLSLVFLLTTALQAHHGSAEYQVDREVVVAGRVKEWRFTNPHTWISLAVTRPDGAVEEWNGEGPPLQWVTSRRWSETTLKVGETVRLVMYPSRRNPRGGLVKRIDRDGREPLLVNRPWLDAR